MFLGKCDWKYAIQSYFYDQGVLQQNKILKQRVEGKTKDKCPHPAENPLFVAFSAVQCSEKWHYVANKEV